MLCETLCQKKARRPRRVQQFMLMARGLSPILPNKQVPVLAPSPRAIQRMARAAVEKLWLGTSRGVGQEWNLMLGKERHNLRRRINYSDSGIRCYKKCHWKTVLSEGFEFSRSCLTSLSRENYLCDSLALANSPPVYLAKVKQKKFSRFSYLTMPSPWFSFSCFPFNSFKTKKPKYIFCSQLK